MSTEGVKSALSGQPFRPFVVRTTSGATFEVNHPEFFAVSFSDRRMFVVLDEQHQETIDTLMLKSFRVKEPAVTA